MTDWKKHCGRTLPGVAVITAAIYLLCTGVVHAGLIQSVNALFTGYSLYEHLGEARESVGKILDGFAEEGNEEILQEWQELEKVPGNIIMDAIPVFRVAGGFVERLRSAKRRLERYVIGAPADARAALATDDDEWEMYGSDTDSLRDAGLGQTADNPAESVAPSDRWNTETIGRGWDEQEARWKDPASAWDDPDGWRGEGNESDPDMDPAVMTVEEEQDDGQLDYADALARVLDPAAPEVSTTTKERERPRQEGPIDLDSSVVPDMDEQEDGQSEYADAPARVLDPNASDISTTKQVKETAQGQSGISGQSTPDSLSTLQPAEVDREENDSPCWNRIMTCHDEARGMCAEYTFTTQDKCLSSVAQCRQLGSRAQASEHSCPSGPACEVSNEEATSRTYSYGTSESRLRDICVGHQVRFIPQ